MFQRDNIYYIFYKPAVPGNIGASARAIKTMGFDKMRLIEAADHLSDDAKMFAHGSHDILEKAEIYNSFPEATKDLDFLISTTANTDKNAKVNYLSASEIAGFISKKGAYAGKTGIIFGSEESGLPSEIIRNSNIGLTIPMQGTYPSLNLSQAVMIIAYELNKGIMSFTTPEETATDQQAEASWKVLQRNTSDLLIKSGIEPPTPLYHRMIERLSFLSGSDARLLHSAVSRLIKMLN